MNRTEAQRQWLKARNSVRIHRGPFGIVYACPHCEFKQVRKSKRYDYSGDATKLQAVVARHIRDEHKAPL